MSFIRGLGVQIPLRDKALIVYVEALEDRNADVRCAACIAIRLMKVTVHSICEFYMYLRVIKQV